MSDLFSIRARRLHEEAERMPVRVQHYADSILRLDCRQSCTTCLRPTHSSKQIVDLHVEMLRGGLLPQHGRPYRASEAALVLEVEGGAGHILWRPHLRPACLLGLARTGSLVRRDRPAQQFGIEAGEFAWL